MKDKIYKRKRKLKIPYDWLTAIIVMAVFCFLHFFNQIDWSWYWLVSPIWILASIYFVLTSCGMLWWFGWGKKQQNKDEWKN